MLVTVVMVPRPPSVVRASRTRVAVAVVRSTARARHRTVQVTVARVVVVMVVVRLLAEERHKAVQTGVQILVAVVVVAVVLLVEH